jgi:hypothetical protein
MMRNNGKLLLGGALLTATIAAAVALASIRAGAEDHATGVSPPVGPPAPTATGFTQESAAPQGAPRNGPVQMVYFTIYDDGILPREAKVGAGNVLVSIKDNTGKSAGLIVEHNVGRSAQEEGRVEHTTEHGRARQVMRLAPGRYRVFDASSPRNQATLVVE